MKNGCSAAAPTWSSGGTKASPEPGPFEGIRDGVAAMPGTVSHGLEAGHAGHQKWEPRPQLAAVQSEVASSSRHMTSALDSELLLSPPVNIIPAMNQSSSWFDGR